MSNADISVAVLLSAGRHPVSGAPRACLGDTVALGLARKLANDAVQAVHVGRPDEPALDGYLAFGATRIDVLTVEPGHDVVEPLRARLQGVDLIVTGSRTEAGLGSGLLPYVLARALNRPVVANILATRLEGRDVHIRQFLPKGKRRKIAVPLPAVLVAHPLAPVELRYAHARRVSGRIAVETVASAQDDAAAAQWSVETVKRRPIRLKAEEKKAGHARLLSAIGSETKAGIVAIDGSSVDKAQILLSYLREHRLIDF